MALSQCCDATRALAIASSEATGTNAKVLPAANLVGRWFSNPISAGISDNAAASLSDDGSAPLSSGSLGASNSAKAAAPVRSRTPTLMLPIGSSSTISASPAPSGDDALISASSAAVPTVGCPANGSSAAGVKMRTRAVCALF